MIHTSGSTLARHAPHTPPLVSVCIPSHRPHLLAETVASVRAQTYPNVEIIVKEHKDWWQRKINDLVRAASGKYFLIVPDDDLLEPTYIAEGVAALDSSTARIFFTGQQLIGDQDRYLPPGAWTRDGFAAGNPVGGMTGLIYHGVWDDIGGYDPFVMFQDYYFWGRAFRMGCKAVTLDRPLLRYRWHAGMKGKSEDHAAGLAEVRTRLGF